VLIGAGPDIVVHFPSDVRVRYVIDTLASYVLQDGCAFEQAVMSYEQENPEFAFLFDLSLPDHVYYRWRLYSMAQGDTLRNWRIEPFVLLEGGPRCASSQSIPKIEYLHLVTGHPF
jgi:U2-associated protein SR140